MTFRVGQKVVRIDVSPEIYAENSRRCLRRQGSRLAEVGTIYTIRAINDWGDRTLLRFMELDNTHITAPGQIEPGFDSRAFLPLVERKTELPASLTALLDPANHVPLKEPAMTGG